jgi:hypothetical protein
VLGKHAATAPKKRAHSLAVPGQFALGIHVLEYCFWLGHCLLNGSFGLAMPLESHAASHETFSSSSADSRGFQLKINTP